MGENVTGKNDYYKSGRGIACWGDSMTEGMGSDEGYLLTDIGRVDISYYTSPHTIERLTGYRTYNFGVAGEKSDEISRRAGGLGMYTDRDLYITKYQYTDVALVDEMVSWFICTITVDMALNIMNIQILYILTEFYAR